MTLLDRLYAWRNRLVSSPAFQRWASAFILTRPIARARAHALFDLCAGFVYSQILLAAVRLGLLDHLSGDSLTIAELAPRMGLSEDATARLLAATTALGLSERRSGGRFGLGMQGAALRGNPGISAMIEHHTHLYADLNDPVALLRGQGGRTELSRYWPYAEDAEPAALTDDEVRAYTELMSASQGLIAHDILDAVSLRPYTCLLDVGGGDGTFVATAARRWPELRVMLFDLPRVVEQAGQRLRADDLGARLSLHSGDFCRDALPRGADIISLVRVILDHDDARVLEILRNVHAALPEGGVLLLAETMSGVRGAETISDAYFGFYLMAMGRGRPRTPDHIARLLSSAGFGAVKLRRTRRPMLTQVMTARRP